MPPASGQQKVGCGKKSEKPLPGRNKCNLLRELAVKRATYSRPAIYDLCRNEAQRKSASFRRKSRASLSAIPSGAPVEIIQRTDCVSGPGCSQAFAVST